MLTEDERTHFTFWDSRGEGSTHPSALDLLGQGVASLAIFSGSEVAMQDITADDWNFCRCSG